MRKRDESRTADEAIRQMDYAELWWAELGPLCPEYRAEASPFPRRLRRATRDRDARRSGRRT